MSLQEEGPQEIQRETAARIIQKAWRSYVNSKVLRYFKDLISRCNKWDPQTILKTVNPREAELLDAAAGVFIRFRLGGITFPPNIYYKIFTHRPITDMCASSPKDYTQPGLKKPVARQTNNGWPLMQEDRSGWYQRMENNSWRLFCSKVVPMDEAVEIGAIKKMEFHCSRLQRQQDVDKWRKKRKIEWLKQMYNQGRLQTHPEHRHMATLVGNSAQEVMDTIEEKGDDEILEWELDELLAWTNSLNFEEYMQEWKGLACSQFSEPSEDVHSYPPRLDPHEFAAVADEDSKEGHYRIWKMGHEPVHETQQHRTKAAEMANLKTGEADDWIEYLIQEFHKAKELLLTANSRVGSAMLPDNGKISSGCSVENACFYLGLCAERTAINKAVSEGYMKFKFGDMPVFMTTVDGSYTVMTSEELLEPLPWGAEYMKK